MSTDDKPNGIITSAGGPFTMDANRAAAYGAMSVVIGHGSVAKHPHAVLIGAGLVSDRPYQLKIGNSEVAVSRDMTESEFKTLYDAISALVVTPYNIGRFDG